MHGFKANIAILCKSDVNLLFMREHCEKRMSVRISLRGDISEDRGFR
jgi:hypothetical protein